MALYMGTPEICVVLCTLNRPEELAQCMESLSDVSLNIQWVLITERGPLARLRNQGLRASRAPITCFVDDDIVASPGYLQRVLSTLGRPRYLGVTGPSRIHLPFRQHRALYQHRYLRLLHDLAFVYPESHPGHLTKAGTFVPDPEWSYIGTVQFLEACHMSFKTEALNAIGGFDETYGGIGDWSEPDVCFRLARRFGVSRLWFDPRLNVEHHCSPNGAFGLRRHDATQRLANYDLFASRWVTPTWRHRGYRWFLWSYYVPWHSVLRRIHGEKDQSA